MKSLILLGGGGHCKSVIEVAESAGYHIVGILDRKENVGREILSTRIIGTDEDIPSFINSAEFLVTVGSIKSPAVRIELYEKIKAGGGRLATIIASTAYVSKYAEIGEGAVVMHKAFVNAGAKVGRNCIINTMASIDHCSQVGDFTHLSANALVAGDVTIGKRCFCGIGSIVSNGITITDDVVLGAGSLVIKDIDVPGLYIGSPSFRYLK